MKWHSKLREPAGVAALLLALSAPAVQAGEVAIDLNDFFADPTVTVAPDGSSAVMAEDPGFSEVILENDPGLGDPDVISSGPGVTLSVDYVFDEPTADGNNDLFRIEVINGATGRVFDGPYVFTLIWSAAGTATFDLSDLDDRHLVGLRFRLVARDTDAGMTSTVAISNVKLIMEDPPLPLSEYGDANQDGTVNFADLLIAIQVLTGMRVATPEEFERLDMGPLQDGLPAPDGSIGSGDVLLLQRKIHGLLGF